MDAEEAADDGEDAFELADCKDMLAREDELTERLEDRTELTAMLENDRAEAELTKMLEEELTLLDRDELLTERLEEETAMDELLATLLTEEVDEDLSDELEEDCAEETEREETDDCECSEEADEEMLLLTELTLTLNEEEDDEQQHTGVVTGVSGGGLVPMRKLKSRAKKL